MIEDNRIMESVLDKAAQSLENGESPFAAAIAVAGVVRVLESSHAKSTDNPIMHSEIVSLNAFCKRFPSKELEHATIYCSCEPCVMCLSAMWIAGIRRIVYGASLEDALAYKVRDIQVRIRDIAEALHLPMEIRGELRREESAQIFAAYIEKYGAL